MKAADVFETEEVKKKKIVSYRSYKYLVLPKVKKNSWVVLRNEAFHDTKSRYSRSPRGLNIDFRLFGIL